MNTEPSTPQTATAPDAARGIVRYAIAVGFVTLLQALSLFLAAGRLDWLMGRIYVASLVLNQAAAGLVLALSNPALLADRSRNEGPRDLDRLLSGVMSLFGPIAILIVAGLDERFGWSPELALWLQVGGVVAVLLSYLLGIWALGSNRHFYGVYRVDAAGGHAVATTGPYRFVRHPGYLAAILFNLGTALFLGSLWALIPALLTVAATVARTSLEDGRLQQDLPGYDAFARQTRRRLVPGIW